MPVQHRFVNPKADGADATITTPSNWNSDHKIAFVTFDQSIASVAQLNGTFDVTGLTGLTADKPVYIMQAAGPYVSKGDREDEAEMDQVQITAYVVNATTVRCYWTSPTHVVGSFKFMYLPGE